MCHAHCIEDDAFLMLQRGHLSYLHPKHCPTREQEVALEHLTNKSMRPDAPGFAESGKFAAYLQGAKEERPLAACSTLIDISEALRRRGGGFQVGGLMDACVHERIRSFLIRHLRKESPRPDLIAPSVEEVLECDKAIFVALQKGCDRDDAGLASLSLQVDKVLENNEIIAMVVGVKMGHAPRGQQPKREAPASSQATPPAAKAKVTPGDKAAKNKAQRDSKKARM